MGMGQNETTMGPQVLVHVSIYQGKPFWVHSHIEAAWGSLLRDEPVETSPVPPSPPPTPLDPSQRKELAVGGLEALLVDAPPELRRGVQLGFAR